MMGRKSKLDISSPVNRPVLLTEKRFDSQEDAFTLKQEKNSEAPVPGKIDIGAIVFKPDVDNVK